MSTSAGEWSEDVTGSAGDGGEFGTASEVVAAGSEFHGDNTSGTDSASAGDTTPVDGDEQGK